MRTLAELKTWCEGAERLLGDPAAGCGIAFFRYAPGIELFSTLDLAFDYDGRLLLRISQRLLHPLWIPLPLSPRTGPIINGAALQAFGVDKIAPGLWALNPSLNIPRQLHVFVVLYAVPSPAPWESS